MTEEAEVSTDLAQPNALVSLKEGYCGASSRRQDVSH